MFIDHLEMRWKTLNLPFEEKALKIEYPHKEI